MHRGVSAVGGKPTQTDGNPSMDYVLCAATQDDEKVQEGVGKVVLTNEVLKVAGG
jgi:hypothetical protein